MSAEELDKLIDEVKELKQRQIAAKYHGIAPYSPENYTQESELNFQPTQLEEKLTREQYESLLNSRVELDEADLAYEDYCENYRQREINAKLSDIYYERLMLEQDYILSGKSDAKFKIKDGPNFQKVLAK